MCYTRTGNYIPFGHISNWRLGNTANSFTAWFGTLTQSEISLDWFWYHYWSVPLAVMYWNNDLITFCTLAALTGRNEWHLLLNKLKTSHWSAVWVFTERTVSNTKGISYYWTQVTSSNPKLYVVQVNQFSCVQLTHTSVICYQRCILGVF